MKGDVQPSRCSQLPTSTKCHHTPLHRYLQLRAVLFASQRAFWSSTVDIGLTPQGKAKYSTTTPLAPSSSTLLILSIIVDAHSASLHRYILYTHLHIISPHSPPPPLANSPYI